MAKLFRNYNTLTEYEADTNKPVNTVCFIKDAKVIYVDGIQYSHKQLDYLPPAISEAEALEYMGTIIKNAQDVGLIYVKPSPYIYWVGPSNTISISGTNYTAQADKVTIDGVEYYQLKLDKDLDDNFYRFTENNFTNLTFKDVNTSKVTIMKRMFQLCSSLKSLDVSGFKTSNVTDMGFMFNKCSNLTSLDVSNFDTSNITSMKAMFQLCSSLKSLDVSRWNTSNVTDMSYMFNKCSGLKSLDVSNFDTSNVTNMFAMFNECNSLTLLDISNWNISNVTNMYAMVSGCNSLTLLDISGWDTSNVTNINRMFEGCSALKTIRMVGCSQTTIDKIKAQLSTDRIIDCTIVTE